MIAPHVFDRDLEAEERAAWCMDAVHLLFSGAAAAGAAAYVAAAPAALHARWAPPADSDAAAAADLLACVAAGFYGFQLWALVRHRCALAMWVGSRRKRRACEQEHRATHFWWGGHT